MKSVMKIALKPLYEVTRRASRGAHLYGITGGPQDLKSVTNFLQVLAKPALVGWAAREALEGVRRELYLLLGDKTSADVRLDIQWCDALLEQAAKRPEKVKTDAGEIGTQLHNAVDIFIKTGKWPDGCEHLDVAMASFMRWWRGGRKIVVGDTFVASAIHGFGGAFDAVEEREDGLWILDFKTSNGIWNEMGVQLGGYAIAFEETFGIKPAGGTIIRFGKVRPEFEARDVADLEACKAAFLDAMHLKTALAVELYVKGDNENVKCSDEGRSGEESARRERHGKGAGGRTAAAAADGAGGSAGA